MREREKQNPEKYVIVKTEDGYKYDLIRIPGKHESMSGLICGQSAEKHMNDLFKKHWKKCMVEESL